MRTKVTESRVISVAITKGYEACELLQAPSLRFRRVPGVTSRTARFVMVATARGCCNG